MGPVGARGRSRRGWVLVLAALVGLACCCGSPPPPAAEIAVYPVGDRVAAPELRGQLLDAAGSFDLARHAGDVVVVNFWASWCAPCRVEADDLEQTYQATKGGGVTFLGINIRDDRDAAVSFARGRASYPSVFDPTGRLALGFSVPPTAIPSTIVIDRSGRIAAVARRAVLRGELEPLVTRLAAEPRPSPGGGGG